MEDTQSLTKRLPCCAVLRAKRGHPRAHVAHSLLHLLGFVVERLGHVAKVCSARVLGRLFQSSPGLGLEHLELLAHLIISYFVELFCFLVIHPTLDEVRGCGLRGGELVKQEGRVGIQEEVPEITFAVFVAYIADEGEVGVIVFGSDLLQGLLDQLVALVVAVREQEQDQHVREPLLDGAVQGLEELLFQ